MARAVRAAVAAGHEMTALAGARALEEGGNAVDAVVAGGVMSWAAEPALTGPCGGGFVLARPADGRRAALLDAFTAIPGRDLPPDRKLAKVEEVLVPFDERTTQVFHVGSAACAVPGVVAGLYEVHRRYGRLPWKQLLLPAAEAADGGVATNPGQQRVFDAIRVILTRTTEALEIFAPGGEFVVAGTVIRQPDLAQTIERLAERGPDDLYRGPLGRRIVEHQHQHGGRLTIADLASYRPVWRRPLRTTYRGRDLLTNPPPSSGGVLIAHMLRVLDGVPPQRPAGRAPALRALAEAMRSAGRLRNRRFGSLLHRGGLAAHALSDEVVGAGREAVRRALQGMPPAESPLVRSDAGTTHFSVVDGEGSAAAFTASNGSHSGVIVPGTGIHLNNMMGEEDLAAGRDLAPGKRLTSMQAPTMVEQDGDVRLVVGSSGSNRLRSAILQVIVNVIDHGMAVQDAVSFPRVHVEGARLDAEGGLDPEELDRLQAWGEAVVRFDSLNLYFGGANAVLVEAGVPSAAGDPRRDCAGVVIDL